MNCEEAMRLLDAYLDGELATEERQILEDHAVNCEACGTELRAALWIGESLAHIDDELTVPLKAQAAWRRAVRAEAAKKKRRRTLRGLSAAAALLVLMFGAHFALDRAEEEPVLLLNDENVASSRMIVASDGADDMEADLKDYALWKKFEVASLSDAVQSLEALAAEYSGSCDADAAGICHIEIPYVYLEDFVKASGQIGTELYAESGESSAETARILFQLYEMTE